MDYYYKYLKYKQKYFDLKDQNGFAQSDRIKIKYFDLKESIAQSDTSDRLIGGKKRTKKNKREVSNQLEITILKQGIKSDKVLSCSYFTMKDAYRQVEKYQNNLKKFLESKKQLKGFETRIYTDDSGKDFALEVAKNDPTVSIYHFNFSPLREDIGHIGTFGTYVRFLPLFEKGLKTVWISDIDIPNHYLDPSILIDAQKENVDFCYRTYVCNETRLYSRSYNILAGTIISFTTFSKKLFDNFLNDLILPNEKLLIIINNLNEKNQKRNKPYSKIPYGIDEIFINHNLVKSKTLDKNQTEYLKSILSFFSNSKIERLELIYKHFNEFKEVSIKEPKTKTFNLKFKEKLNKII